MEIFNHIVEINLVYFQNEKIFVQLDEIDELDRINQA